MKGLEVSEINYSEIRANNFDFRIDSEYLKKEYIKYFGSNTKHNSKIDNLAVVKGGKRLPLGESFSTEGTPYIRAEDVKNSFVDYSNSPKISPSVFKQIAQYQTKKNDVLLTIVGNSIGDVGFVLFDLDICNLTENCVRLESKNINPFYLFVYFLSKYGQMQIERERVGTAQPKLAIERIRRFEIYVPKNEFQSEIEQIVKMAYSTLFNSKRLYSVAENQLLEELGLKNWQPQNQNINVKNLSESFLRSGRLDAEYYQSKYDHFFTHLSKYECDTIKDISHIKKSIEPGSDAYQDNGIPFVRVSDVDKFGISEPNVFLSPGEFDFLALRPKKDTILLSKDGSVGIAYKVEKDLDCITSGALLHLTVFNKDYNPDYLTLVLNSKIVKMQAERDANGAIIQHWKPSEIEQVIIPKLPMSIQEEISAKIQKSFALKAESKRLLEQAKLMVEQEIEKGGK